jgi:PAS domain S-box-containing protein
MTTRRSAAGDNQRPKALRLRTLVVAGGLLLALAAVVAAVAFSLYERRERLRAELTRSELLVRVLEDHATRSFETASLALAALADVVIRNSDGGAAQLGSVLAQTMVGLPVLRGMAVLDAQGRVLASTSPGELDASIDLQRLGAGAMPGREFTGGFVPGRGLLSLQRGAPAAVAPRGVGFVPMVRPALTRNGELRWLVATVNPDAIANHLQRVLNEPTRSALLTDFGGQTLAGTAEAPVQPGQSVATLPVFRQYLPGTESGSYVGEGLRPGTQLVAFRASRTRALVLVVEISQDHALALWQRDARWLGAGSLLLALFVAAMTLTAARSLKARELARHQRDQAQALVAQRERELSVIFKSVQEVLFRTDAQGRLSFVNARWLSASGLPEAGALGLPLATLVRPESAAAAAALFAADGPPGTRSAVLMLGSGPVERQFEMAVAPLLAEGRIVGYAGSAVDITERIKAQAQLQAQLAFTELLLEVMPLPLSILDTEGRYVSVNQAWEDFTGRRRDQVAGRHAQDELPGGEARVHDERDAELLRRGGRVRYHSTALHRDGTRRDLAITKAAVPGADDRPAGTLVAFMDVSEFRQAERATREARDAAEEASRAKTEFVANISHELRTPLQSIIGFSELGLVRSGAQPKLNGMFGDIHAAGQRMLALVNDLLDVSKIESTVGTFHLERTDVRSLVRDVLGELRPLLDAKRLAVDLHLSDGPLVAKVDPTRFQQVVRNVLANAIRFSPEGEGLQVHGDIDADNRIHLSVADRGPGIPPGELDKIFEAFVQSSKTKDGSGGTGLGLAICRKILEAHGGEIRAENNADRGSSFHVYLPARGFVETMPG